MPGLLLEGSVGVLLCMCCTLECYCCAVPRLWCLLVMLGGWYVAVLALGRRGLPGAADVLMGAVALRAAAVYR